MHAHVMVSRVLEPCLTALHQKRKSALLKATAGLLRGGVASLSGIALNLGGGINLRHRIKSVDRLLGNQALRQLRIDLYRRLALCWLRELPQLLVVVDWSDLTRNQRWHLLRASVVVEGRSLTLYEEVHPQSRLNNGRVHRNFLARLASIIPVGCRPIIMTDAGFHADWFKLVSRRGWDFVGRVRGRNRIRCEGSAAWIPVRDLYPHAGSTALDLGLCTYVRSNPVKVRAVLSKRPSSGRHQFTIYGNKRIGSSSAKNARRAREPWLLVSSIGLQHLEAQAIVTLYAQRMRIEQSFRDTKNLRWGLGLAVAQSRSGGRFEMLLLIVHLASFVQRLIGAAAHRGQLALQFMAKHRADRHEISFMTLGRRVLEIAPDQLRKLIPHLCITPLSEQAKLACQFSEAQG